MRSFSISAVGVVVCAAAVSLAGCGGGSTSSVPAPVPVPTTTAPNNVPLATGAKADWPTFAHDATRSGYQDGATGITASNAATLATRWVRHFAPETIKASVVEAGGTLYVATEFGTVHALDARTGTLLWTAHVPGPVDATPAFADGALFVGTHGNPGSVVALDATTGAERWSHTFAVGAIRSDVLVENHVVYVGENDGDPPTCNQGGVHAYDEVTGAPLFFWPVDTRPHDGGSVWAPISSDGQHIFFGTGNGCSDGIGIANSMVRMSLQGQVQWSFESEPSGIDDDFGGGVLLADRLAIATGKNGTVYALDQSTGSTVWKNQIGMFDGGGGIGTPSTDGAVLVVSDGFLTPGPPDTYEGAGGKVLGMDLRGHVLWARTTVTPVFGYAAMTGGVAFLASDRMLVALDERSGSSLAAFPLDSLTYGAPIVVDSGVYVAVNDGDVFAFGLPAAKASAIRAARVR